MSVIGFILVLATQRGHSLSFKTNSAISVQCRQRGGPSLWVKTIHGFILVLAIQRGHSLSFKTNSAIRGRCRQRGGSSPWAKAVHGSSSPSLSSEAIVFRLRPTVSLEVEDAGIMSIVTSRLWMFFAIRSLITLSHSPPLLKKKKKKKKKEKKKKKKKRLFGYLFVIRQDICFLGVSLTPL